MCESPGTTDLISRTHYYLNACAYDCMQGYYNCAPFIIIENQQAGAASKIPTVRSSSRTLKGSCSSSGTLGKLLWFIYLRVLSLNALPI